MKTNGEADSSQVSGNCRGGEGEREEKNSLASSYTELARPYCALNMLSFMMPGITVMNDSASISVYTPTSGKMSSVPDVRLHAPTATNSYESLWVLCAIIAQLMMQLVMKAVSPLASSKDKTKIYYKHHQNPRNPKSWRCT